jgi:hypothetical protein
MTAILEAVGAGTAVALINRFIISNNWLWGLFLGCTAHPTTQYNDDQDCTSSSSTSTIDAVEIHTHF